MGKEQLGNLAVLVRTDDVIDAIDLFDEARAQVLRHAACHDELDPWTVLLEELHLGYSRLGAFFRLFPYGTGVEEKQIRFFGVFGGEAAVSFEHRRDERGIVLVHLAAVGIDQVSGRHL